MTMFPVKNIISTALFLCAGCANAAVLQDIKFAELPGEKAELKLVFDTPPTEPTGYSIDQPARIVLDFSDVENALSKKKYTMGVGEINSAVIVEGGGRTRLIVNLDSLAPYSTSVDGNSLVVEVGNANAVSEASFSENGFKPTANSVADVAKEAGSKPAPISNKSSRPSVSTIQNVDFKRGDKGEGKVVVRLTNPTVKIDVEEKASGVEVKFLETELPSEFNRVLDVTDFATPVTRLSTSTKGDSVVMKVAASGEYDYLAYQADNEYVISIKPLSKQEVEEKKKKFAYVGERLSLSFQDIPVRNVLQLIADFTDFNLVASDTVEGKITLRLENVPWDQALDIVLKTKGLDKRQIGNVLMVAPAAEIAERERQEIETQKQLQELAPLRTEYIRIRYANARELFNLFSDESNGGNGGGQSSGSGSGSRRNSTGTILSDRGQAIVDERTNSIILTDTEEKITEFKRIISQIDIPIRQVMIEARIVRADSDFRKELGVRISGDAVQNTDSNSMRHEFTGRMDGLAAGDGDGATGPSTLFVDSDGDGVADGTRDLDASRLVDLGVFDPAGAFTWNIISSKFLLAMELSALEDSGYAEIVSQPKVITGDKQQASIMSGAEVGYQEESASGGTTTSFKEAVLKLDVTPQITPDNRIIMDLEITQDSLGGETTTGVPTLDVTRLNTQVLVEDGATIVLGGIYQTESTKGVTKVPLLGDIPYLGRLFRNDLKSETKRELLLFITPRIMASDIVEN